jgi:zinc protease
MSELLNINFKKEILDNGLEVIISEDNSIPIVSVNLWYKVGSANESRGKTGFAHLFEHMMFQGSLHVPKEMHFRYIQEAGGTLNGSTSFDKTNYYETLPSNSLELALWLESDRMGFLLPALTQEKLNNQKDVVMNERRQNYDNQPYGLQWELLFSNLFPSDHPYSWPTIGLMSDIEKFELEDVRNFFNQYYSPDNASLVIAGNVNTKDAFGLVKKYFDDIPANQLKHSVKKINPQMIGNKLYIHQDNVQLSKIYFAWNTVSQYEEDDAALEILSVILSGNKNSKLNKVLVFEKQIAQNISAFQFAGVVSGAFIITATIKPNVSAENVKEEIMKVISELHTSITDDEISRAKNGIKSVFIASLQHMESLADQMNHYNTYLNNPNAFQYDLNRYNSVTKEKLITVATKYFSQYYSELRIVPKEDKNAE